MEMFFLLRHGETAWNKQRRVMGRLEVPLNRAGRAQSRRMAESLCELRLDAVYTSPLKRAVQTTEIVARQSALTAVSDDNLSEFAFGRWSGHRYDALLRSPRYRRFLQAPLVTAVPGGETIRDVQRRGLTALKRAAQEFPGGRILLVSHGDVIRAILCHYMRLPLGQFRRLRIDNGALAVFESDGAWAEIKVINYLPELADVCRPAYPGLKPDDSGKRA